VNFTTISKWAWIPGMAYKLAGVKFRVIDVDATGLFVLTVSLNNPAGDDVTWMTPTHYGAEPDLTDAPTVELLSVWLREIRGAPDGVCRPSGDGKWTWEDRPNAPEGFSFTGENRLVVCYQAGATC
jgi:hypothetical protein